MKAEKETLKENVLIDIDEFMDSQFGKPGTPENTTSVTSNSSLMQIKRGGYLKSLHLAV